MTPITLRSLQLGGVILCIVAVVITAIAFPLFAPPTFLIACSIMLFLALWIHRSEFGAEEYERNTLKYTLRNIVSGVVLFIAVFGIVGFWYYSQNNTAVVGPAPSPIVLPTVGGGLTSVAKNVASRIKEVMRTGSISV
jgi:hypothetical protein